MLQSNQHALTDLNLFEGGRYEALICLAECILYVPSGVTDEVRKVVVPAIEKAVKNAEMAAKLEKLGFMVEYRSPAELRKLQESDYARARPLVLKLGLGK